MAIRVSSEDGSWDHLDATGWHIDELGFLHIRGKDGKGNVATYHSARWTWVGRS